MKIQGKRQYLWRAIDQDGDILVQPRRDRKAAKRFFHKLLKGQARSPWRLVTDKRRCCTARSKSLTSLCRLQSHPAQYVSGIPSAAI